MKEQIKRYLNSIKQKSKVLTEKNPLKNKLPIFTLAFILTAVVITLIAVQHQQNLIQNASEICEETSTDEEQYVNSGEAIRSKRQVTVKINKTTAYEAVVKQKNRIPGRLIVKYKKGKSKSSAEKIIRAEGGSVTERDTTSHFDVIQTSRSREEKTYNQLAADPNVAYVEPDFQAYPAFIPDDPEFKNQWGLNNEGQNGGTVDIDINAPEAWEKTKGSKDVRIAIIDSGIDEDHEDLQGKIVADYTTGTTDDYDDAIGHGTQIAGIVAASTDNGIGIAGVCPDCSLLNAKIVPSDISTDSSAHYSDIAKAISWATGNGASVINISFVGTEDSNILKEAINEAVTSGVIVVAAAGNCGDQHFKDNNCTVNNQVMYPAAYENVIAVAATDNNDKKANISNHGDHVDVAAPGVAIRSTAKGGAYSYSMGTSRSAAFVSGLAGLLFSQGLEAAEVREKIESTADKIDGTGVSWKYGRINASRAVGGISQHQEEPTDTEATITDSIDPDQSDPTENEDVSSEDPEPTDENSGTLPTCKPKKNTATPTGSQVSHTTKSLNIFERICNINGNLPVCPQQNTKKSTDESTQLFDTRESQTERLCRLNPKLSMCTTNPTTQQQNKTTPESALDIICRKNPDSTSCKNITPTNTVNSNMEKHTDLRKKILCQINPSSADCL